MAVPSNDVATFRIPSYGYYLGVILTTENATLHLKSSYSTVTQPFWSTPCHLAICATRFPRTHLLSDLVRQQLFRCLDHNAVSLPPMLPLKFSQMEIQISIRPPLISGKVLKFPSQWKFKSIVNCVDLKAAAGFPVVGVGSPMEN